MLPATVALQNHESDGVEPWRWEESVVGRADPAVLPGAATCPALQGPTLPDVIRRPLAVMFAAGPSCPLNTAASVIQPASDKGATSVRASGGLSAGAERLRPLRCGDPDLQFAVRRQLVARDQALEPWSPPQWRIEGIDAQQRKRDRGRDREQVFELVEGGIVLPGPYIDLNQVEHRTGSG